MDAEDHISNAYEVVDFIHRHIREKGERPTIEDILEVPDISKDNLEALLEGDYIEKYSHKRYDLTGKGAEFLRSSKLNERLDNSIEQEKISSAAETIFTVTILFGAWLQTSIAVSNNLSNTEMMFNVGSLNLSLPLYWILQTLLALTFIGLGYTAYQISSEVLKEKFKERTTLGKLLMRD